MPSTSALRGALAQDKAVIPVPATGTLILSTDQAKIDHLLFTGTITGNVTVVLPVAAPDDQGKVWTIANFTAGAFTLSIAAPVQTGYAVSQGFRTRVYFDGVDFVPEEAGCVRRDQTIVSGITGVSPTVTLTNAQAHSGAIILQGNATGTPVIIVPNGISISLFINQLAVGVSVKTLAGTLAALPASPNGNKWVLIDGAGNANLSN